MSRVVQMIKGNLSRQLFLNYPALLERNRTKTPWAKGYFARSSGKADVETVRQYVADQAHITAIAENWRSFLLRLKLKLHQLKQMVSHKGTLPTRSG